MLVAWFSRRRIVSVGTAARRRTEIAGICSPGSRWVLTVCPSWLAWPRVVMLLARGRRAAAVMFGPNERLLGVSQRDDHTKPPHDSRVHTAGDV